MKRTHRKYLGFSPRDWLPSAITGNAMQNFLGLWMQLEQRVGCWFFCTSVYFPFANWGIIQIYSVQGSPSILSLLYQIFLKILLNLDHFSTQIYNITPETIDLLNWKSSELWQDQVEVRNCQVCYQRNKYQYSTFTVQIDIYLMKYAHICSTECYVCFSSFLLEL